MKTFSLFILTCCCIVNMSFAQSFGQIQGSAVDNTNEAVLYGNVILHSAADSSIVKIELTDADGNFIFQKINPAKYWIALSYVGMDTYNTEVFTLKAGETFKLPKIQMKNSSTDLAEVTVTAQRPLLEIKPDKLVFNVEGSVNAVGSDALELLKKSPGVVVDNNDNITMLGRSGVQVYINGKQSPLSTEDLAAYLKTIQSDQIDAIEIITNPSSKYDAEGSAGIINIKLKKDKRFGTNTSLNLGYSVGELPKYNAGISSNYRNAKVNLFGSYNYNHGYNINFNNLFREQFGLAFKNTNLGTGSWTNHSVKAGLDYSINDKHTIGILATGNLSDNDWNNVSETPISRIGQEVDSTLFATGRNDNMRNNFNVNLNYVIDNGKGKTWNIDADYGQFRNTGTEDQPNIYKDTEGNILNQRIFFTDTPVDIDIMTFKVDSEHPLGKGVFGAGVKMSYVKTDNTFDFYDVIASNKILNKDRSNNFVYTENVNAAYANYKQQFKKFGFQVGLRLEHTNSEGDLTSFQSTNNNKVKRDTLDFFPSAGVTYQLNPKNTFQLSYSRRINRPSYQDLNPFENRLDELTFEKGNPFLKPEYSNKFQLTHTFNYMINTSLGYSQTTNLITRIVDIDDRSDKASFITWLNLAKQHNYSINVSGGVPITKWWSSYTSLTGYQTHNIADYGGGKVVDVKVSSFNIYSQHTFRLPKSFSFEVSGWYNSPSIWGGTFEMDAMWSMDAGIQKRIWNGKANLRVSVSDIFRTNEWSGLSRFGEVTMDANGGWDSRRLKVNFTYMFGNNNVKSRRRTTGLEEEAKRVKSDN